MKFTETWLKSVQPKDKPYRVFEKGLTKGFGIQVTPKGVISFFLCYQDGSTTRYKTLGSYPALTLLAARDEAVALRKKLDSGEDPTTKVGTLQHLCDAYLNELTAGGAKTVDDIRRVFQHDVLSVLSPSMQAKDVTSEDVRVIMHRCIERGANVKANRVRSYLMAAFKNGIKHDYDPRSLGNKVIFGLTGNPVDLIPRVGSFESVGERVLTLDELKSLWNYQGTKISQIHLWALQLIILFGGLRPSEVTQAAKSEFDFESGVWSIPPARTKNKKWHVLPLTDKTTEIIKQLMVVNPGKSYLISSATGRDEPEFVSSLGHAVVRLVGDLGSDYWSPRDLRRTCKTWAGKAGLSKEIRDRLQNHALTDVSSKHYDRYLYLTEKRDALLVWEAFITRAVGTD